MSNRLTFAALLALVSSAAFTAPAEDEFRISGPFTHDNLSIYFLHKAGKQPATNVLTLAEAMEQKKAAVYETGNVQELSIENRSAQPVFVQAGDIVKGGKQDRVLTTDLLLPPHSGKLPIASFCVEQGRWTKRGAESAAEFNASAAAVPTRALKMAVREKDNQHEVWKKVAEARADLAVASGVAGGVAETVSVSAATSMQVALEDRKVTEAVDRYVSVLTKFALADAVGYAYAINGRFSGADAYASTDLFRRMWPKLLRSSAAEAFAERVKTSTSKAPDGAAVRGALAEGESGRAAPARNNGPLAVTRKESDKSVVYVTVDRDAGGAWLHMSYIAK